MADLKIFTNVIEDAARAQIDTLLAQPAFADCKVRIMPDVHAGAGCVIGFTADLGDKVIPNLVGVDIGCGMLTIALGKVDIDFEKLDGVIHKYIPAGFNVHPQVAEKFDELEDLYCYDSLLHIDRIRCSLGTLGGGNHFIEIDENTRGEKYLVIHSGSRNLGKQVVEYYQNLAIESMRCDAALPSVRAQLIENLKAEGRESEIADAIKDLRKAFKGVGSDVPKELCYLTGTNRDAYLHDMQICQRFAVANRLMMAKIICYHMGWSINNRFETIHNYIELKTNMIRKGAISAKYGEKVLIPINMRDGSIIAVGKGNEDWNCSAPHGAGRLMSRAKAKREISLAEFEKSMEGIYTTSVNKSTLDESPMAYKSFEDIADNIEDTVDIKEVIKPIYNFKASE